MKNDLTARQIFSEQKEGKPLITYSLKINEFQAQLIEDALISYPSADLRHDGWTSSNVIELTALFNSLLCD